MWKFPGPGIEPALLPWQHQIFNSLCHKRTPGLPLFLWSVLFLFLHPFQDISSYLVVLSSQTPVAIPFSQTFLVVDELADLRILVRYLGDCSSMVICLIFFFLQNQTQIICFWEKATDNTIFLTSDQEYILPGWFIIVHVDSDYLAKVVFAKFLHC